MNGGGPGRSALQAIIGKSAEMRKNAARPAVSAIGWRSASTARALELGAGALLMMP